MKWKKSQIEMKKTEEGKGVGQDRSMKRKESGHGMHEVKDRNDERERTGKT